MGYSTHHWMDKFMSDDKVIKVGDIVDYKGTVGIVMSRVKNRDHLFHVKMLDGSPWGMSPTVEAKPGELAEKFLTALPKSELLTAIRFLQQIITDGRRKAS